MTLPMWIVVAVVAATFVAILTETLRPELAALAGCCVLLATGVLGANDLFPVFGNEAIVTVGAMFVLSAALERTGVIASATRLLQALPAYSERFVLMLLLPPVVLVSAFVNNTPVVVVFLPILLALAKKCGLAASKLLMPLSFASILGGSTTLIGTSTNLVASAAGQRMGLAPIRMFEMSSLGLLLASAGLAMLFIFAPRLLPRREIVSVARESKTDRRFLTEATVREGLTGRTAVAALGALARDGQLVEVVRDEKPVEMDAGNVILQPGDRLRLSLDADGVTTLGQMRGLEIATASGGAAADSTHQIESVVTPHSDLIGKCLDDVQLHLRHRISVLALHRRGQILRENPGRVPLETGDVLLFEASDAGEASLRQGHDLLILDGRRQVPRRHKRWIATGVLLAVVVAAALQALPIATAALIGVIIVITARCIDAEEAYRAIDWPCLFLIAGMLALGIGMEKTHAAEVIARAFVGVVSPLGPWITLSLVILAASALTNFLSNNAVAALLVPLAVESAHFMNVNPRAFLMGVAFGASACFATPIGYQTNTLVYGSGGYRFGDFLRLGLPMNLLHWILASFFVPHFWPL